LYVVSQLTAAVVLFLASAAAEAAAAAANKNKDNDDDPATGIISKIKHIINSILPLRVG
jgi:hypothetical protein